MMESKAERKAAIQAFKERKIPIGTFAVRCTPSGQVWVGASRNLHATRNGLWFGLNHGNHPDRSLQTAWKQHGEPAFTFQILETIEGDLLPMEVPDRLKSAREHWCAQLSARQLF